MQHPAGVFVIIDGMDRGNTKTAKWSVHSTIMYYV